MSERYFEKILTSLHMGYTGIHEFYAPLVIIGESSSCPSISGRNRVLAIFQENEFSETYTGG